MVKAGLHKGVNAISSYKRKYRNANKNLTNDEKELLKVKEEIATLQETEKQIQKKIEEDRQNKLNTGLLYFSDKKRSKLLDKAEDLPISKDTISRLRFFDKDHWNPDHVDLNTIADFESIENYVKDNTPAWEQSPVSRIGKFFNRNE